ncbi:76c548a7-ac78-4461-b63f-3447f579dcd6 [Sclerotinia trifoliorum]|uniref:76c548a7-ac78-4461-b63f-3447f579dcd6 n=1 Tax=Sclerotinia trifoliorum TaxID=28548 RepID=A0A8H2ZNH9_9HELO|nr:76c548a7-ac78-4461-b63f-3447f579dcd6 [Sclerotinia trifoliorum]
MERREKKRGSSMFIGGQSVLEYLRYQGIQGSVTVSINHSTKYGTHRAQPMQLRNLDDLISSRTKLLLNRTDGSGSGAKRSVKYKQDIG